uniref:Secretory peptide n=1 Tax=Heteropoda venatoria TaxID=152925 RepID=A0A088BPM7_HETVE|nr:secretory peptide [Heteropoda venatoria]
MKTTIMITLLIVAISAVALAEESIERKEAAVDPVTGRTLYCGQKYHECKRDMDCCQNLVCSKGNFCR